MRICWTAAIVFRISMFMMSGTWMSRISQTTPIPKCITGAPSRWRTSSTPPSLKRTTDFHFRPLTVFQITECMSGEVSRPEPPQGTHYYCGPSAKDIGAAANPRLWFKGFRTGMSEELFGTIHAVGKER